MAGLTFAPLLQEPSAAALAYGFQSEADNELWLVYDLGGGTFDAAIGRKRDGQLSVVNHRGDNFLGGKLLDWKIVDDLLIPSLAAQHLLADLQRSEPRWYAVINKLKMAAETAKIQLSRADSAEITVDIDLPDSGRVEFEFELRTGDLERIIEPFVARSVNLCRKVLQEIDLGPADIAKMILVGGPTLAPYLRHRLADPTAGLGIPLDHSQDPLTVVARGAAIFGGTQRLPEAALPPPPTPDRFAVHLDYEPMGQLVEPPISGRVEAAQDEDLSGYTIEFNNLTSKPPWRGGKVSLAPDGTFATTLWADKGKLNTFDIELADPTGNRREAAPGSLSYTVGAVDTKPPLTQSIGIGLDGNRVAWVLARNTALPATGRISLRTTVPLRRGVPGDAVLIPLLEGEHDRGDRNQKIGRVEVKGFEVKRDVPADSEVELRIDVDASRLVVARAFIPLLDEEFESTVNLRTESTPRPHELARDLMAEFERLESGRTSHQQDPNSVAEMLFRRIDEEGIVEELTSLVNAAQVDPDAASTAAKRLLDLQALNDEVEDVLKWPDLVREATELHAAVTDVIEKHGEDDDRAELERIEDKLSELMQSHDSQQLNDLMHELQVLARTILERTGALQAIIFEQLKRNQSQMISPNRVERLISEGDRAIANENYKPLEYINQQLTELLPPQAPPSGQPPSGQPPKSAEAFSTVREG